MKDIGTETPHSLSIPAHHRLPNGTHQPGFIPIEGQIIVFFGQYEDPAEYSTAHPIHSIVFFWAIRGSSRFGYMEIQNFTHSEHGQPLLIWEGACSITRLTGLVPVRCHMMWTFALAAVRFEPSLSPTTRHLCPPLFRPRPFLAAASLPARCSSQLLRVRVSRLLLRSLSQPLRPLPF